MAELVFTDAFVSIGGNDISDHVLSTTLDYSADLQENTAMGATTRTRLGGLKDWSLSVELNQDYAAADIDSLMFPLIGTSVAIIIRPDSAVVGAGNPQYTGNGILESYGAISGSIGEAMKTTISIQAAGALARAVA